MWALRITRAVSASSTTTSESSDRLNGKSPARQNDFAQQRQYFNRRQEFRMIEADHLFCGELDIKIQKKSAYLDWFHSDGDEVGTNSSKQQKCVSQGLQKSPSDRDSNKYPEEKKRQRRRLSLWCVIHLSAFLTRPLQSHWSQRWASSCWTSSV